MTTSLFVERHSLYDIAQHLLHYQNPKLQRYIVRILWMVCRLVGEHGLVLCLTPCESTSQVPIYACESWASLRFKDAATYIETLREWYSTQFVVACYTALDCTLNIRPACV